MDERLGFELDIDVDAHKLPPAVQQLIQMDERLGRVGKALDRLERGFGGGIDKMSRGFQGLATSLTGVASALQLVERGFGAAGAVYGAFNKGANYAISAMGERSSSIRGYTQLLGGDKKQAGLEYYRAQEFAQKTDFSSETIEKSQARLLAQGFRGKDLYATLFSAADLAAIMPGNKNETLERVTMAMSQIKAKGKLQGEELTQQLAESGLNTTLVKQQLMKSLGLKSTADVDKKMGKGEISADVALPAIQRAILQQLGTTKAGEYSTSSAGSLTSLISNRDEAAKNLLKSFDADENLPAMERYKKSLVDQGRLFDQNSKTGRSLSLAMQDMADKAIGTKAVLTDFLSGAMESFGESYQKQMDAYKALGGVNDQLKETSSAARYFGEQIGRLGGTFARVLHESPNLPRIIDRASLYVERQGDAPGNIFNDLKNGRPDRAIKEWATSMYRVFGGGGNSPESIAAERQINDEFRDRYDKIADKLGGRTDRDAIKAEHGGRASGHAFDAPELQHFGRDKEGRPYKLKGAKPPLPAADKKGSGPAFPGWSFEPRFDIAAMPILSLPPVTSAAELSGNMAQQIAMATTSSASSGNTIIEKIEILIQGSEKSSRQIADEVVQAINAVFGRVARRPI